MSIVNFEDKLAAASRAFSAALDGVREQPPGTYSIFTLVDGAPTGTSANVGYLDPTSPLGVLGRGESKVFSDALALGATYELEVIYKAHRLDRRDVEHDTSGRVARMLSSFVADASLLVDERIWDLLLANTLAGVDGVSLLNDSHPYGEAGATWDNLTTDALSHASFRAGIAAMRNFKRYDGRPYNINPTHLFVGPDLESTALEVTGADRAFNVTNAGAFDGGANVVAASVQANVMAGRVTPIVVPWITDAQEWLLMDLSKSSKPFYAQVGTIFEQMPDVNDSVVRRSDVFEYAINCDLIAGPGAPQLIYGRLDS